MSSRLELAMIMKTCRKFKRFDRTKVSGKLPKAAIQGAVLAVLSPRLPLACKGCLVRTAKQVLPVPKSKSAVVIRNASQRGHL